MMVDNIENEFAKGEAKGALETRTRDVLAVLEARRIEIPADLRERVLESTDLAELERCLRRAAVVRNAGELFDTSGSPPLITQLRADEARTAWIFGAGASMPYSVPPQNALLRHFFNMAPRGPSVSEDESSMETKKNRVKDHCRAVVPGLEPDSFELVLEEVLAAYELTLSERRASNDERQAAMTALDDLREAIRRSTQLYGPINIPKFKPHARNGTRSPYAELLEKIYPEQSWGAAIGKHVFVTLNYDISLDRCMLSLRKETSVDLDLDYGIPLANDRVPNAPGFDAPRRDSSTLLLRLHGSLNWVRCAACQNVFTTVDRHAKVYALKSCWACGKTRLQDVFVHPSYIRNYNDPLLQVIWGRCYEELIRSERWVFIGYSLPVADVHFREMLRECIRVRRNRDLVTSVIMAGRARVEGDAPDNQSAYEHVFAGSLSVWKATPEGFSDFVDAVI